MPTSSVGLLSALALVSWLSACGDAGHGEPHDQDPSALAEADADADADPLDASEPDCTEKRESWQIAGTISGDDVQSAPATVMLMEEHRRSCGEAPDEIWLETPGRHLGTFEIEAPGTFDVNVVVDYTIEPPDLFVRVHADLNRDGRCDPDDAGAVLFLPPGGKDDVEVVLEPGCPGLPL